MTEAYRYQFRKSVRVDELEATIVLATMACESLHGETGVRLDGRHLLDAATRTCVIDASTEAGRDLNRLFIGFANREFGPDTFCVERVNSKAPLSSEAAAP